MHQLAWAYNAATNACGRVYDLSGDVERPGRTASAQHQKTRAEFIRRLDSPISRMAFRPGSNILATGDIHGEVKLWRPGKAGEMLRSADLGAPVTDLVRSANGKHLAVSTTSGRVYAARICR